MIINKIKKSIIIKVVLLFIFYFLFSLKLFAGNGEFPGFKKSPYYDEQVVTFNLNPDIRIHINISDPDSFDVNKPVGLTLFALPNGNTIEQTVGKILQSGDDWHYDIQHIGAQTRFLRQNITDFNLVIVYLEASQKSWPAWKTQHSDYAEIVKSVVEYLKSYFKDHQPFVVLTGGTWYRSRMMQKYLSNIYTFTTTNTFSLSIVGALKPICEIAST